MFGWFKTRPGRSRAPDALLAQIEADLVRLVPAAAKAAAVPGPAYALILCYIDTTTDDVMPYVVVRSEAVWRRAVARKGGEASRLIWMPDGPLAVVHPHLNRRQPLEDSPLRAKIHAACCRPWRPVTKREPLSDVRKSSG
jgi:hypothetical protein